MVRRTWHTLLFSQLLWVEPLATVDYLAITAAEAGALTAVRESDAATSETAAPVEADHSELLSSSAHGRAATEGSDEPSYNLAREEQPPRVALDVRIEVEKGAQQRVSRSRSKDRRSVDRSRESDVRRSEKYEERREHRSSADYARSDRRRSRSPRDGARHDDRRAEGSERHSHREGRHRSRSADREYDGKRQRRRDDSRDRGARR